MNKFFIFNKKRIDERKGISGIYAYINFNNSEFN